MNQASVERRRVERETHRFYYQTKTQPGQCFNIYPPAWFIVLSVRGGQAGFGFIVNINDCAARLPAPYETGIPNWSSKTGI